ncbi:MAG: dihydroneopterin aldolase [Prevotellaceae bacterium]|nr:dihydroneopterin aldolase [Prevotellaceae bacterium]
MSDKLTGRVFVKNIRLHAFHGVMPQERITGNDYLVSVSADCPLAAAAESDSVDDTLNYAHIYNVVKEEMALQSNLVEHVAGRIGRRVLAEFPLADNVRVEVVKLNPPMGAACDGAGVELTVRR